MSAMKTSTIKFSRTGLNLFLECPRCFWLDIHHKVKRPPGYPFTLSIAVDHLLKLEFDTYRERGELHPSFVKYGLTDAKLYNGEYLAEWRNNFKGVSYYDESLNAILFGAVDDILEFSDGSLAVVDYKSSGAKEIHIYDDYQRQMDVYNWLLRQKGYETQPQAYFVFYKVRKEGETSFDGVLKFTEEVREVRVNAEWVGNAFEQAVAVARSDVPPSLSPKDGHCDHCHYVQMAGRHQIQEDLNI